MNHDNTWLSKLSVDEIQNIRRKYWLVVLWPYDSLLEEWDDWARFEFRRTIVRKFEHAQVPALISPIHEYDLKEDGVTLAKQHVHCILFFDQPQRFTYVLKFLQVACEMPTVSYVEPCNSLKGSMRYLCHLDSPTKRQYDVEDVISVLGAKFTLEEETASDLVTEKILSNGFTRITDLLVYFDSNISARKWILNNPGIVKTLCKEQADFRRASDVV